MESAKVSFFYEDPEEIVDAEDLINIANKRQKLLEYLDLRRGSVRDTSRAQADSLLQLEHKATLLLDKREGRFNDKISHFALKHAFKDNEELSSKWIRQEVLLFKERLKTYNINMPQMLASRLRVFEELNESNIPYIISEDRQYYVGQVYYKVSLPLSLIHI